MMKESLYILVVAKAFKNRNWCKASLSLTLPDHDMLLKGMLRLKYLCYLQHFFLGPRIDGCVFLKSIWSKSTWQ
jgi:hypothetical protein